MVRNVRMQSNDHYELDIETANGVRRTEVGDMDDNGNNEVKGVIKYILPDGTPFILRYIADETGFHPQGNMLPTPPPMPAHSLLQMKKAGMLHHSSEENAMFDSMENDPMFKSMEDMFRSMEDDDLNDSIEINTFKHNHPASGQIVRFDSIEDGFHSIENGFRSKEDRFDSKEGLLDSIEDRYHTLEDILGSREDRFDSREDRFGTIQNRRVPVRNNANNIAFFDSRESEEDRFDSREGRFDSRESKENRVPIRNNANSRTLLRNITNRGGVLLRNRHTGKIVLLRNKKIIDSFERDDFRSIEDNTFEDLDRTDELFSLENRSNENDSLEINLRLNPSIRRAQG